MQSRPLGRTGLKVSEIGFGAASFWGHPAFSEAEALRLVHRALDLGVTLFDTGPAYSLGQAEGRLGRALAGRDLSGLVVATKVGARFEGGRVRRDMSLPAIEASLEHSRRRLGLESLPLVHLHGPSAQELTPDFLGGLERLREQGLFQRLGVNNFDPAVIDAALAWVLGIEGVSTALVGTTRAGHLEEAALASGVTLPAELAVSIACTQTAI
jgi:aryl-alcohol dehydrogenase-like predicted oxidoreductase